MRGTRKAARRRIVFVGGTSEPGGLHIHMADVAQTCAALGCDVSILCPSIDYFDGLITDDAVTVQTINAAGLATWRDYRSVWGSARGAARADLVLCRGNFALSPMRELLTAAAVGRRVYTIDHRPHEGVWNHRLSKRSYGTLSSLVVRRMIAVSDEIADDAARDFRVPRRKIATCLNWVHPQFEPQDETVRNAWRAKVDIAPDSFVVGFVGRLAPEKRVDVLVRAFAKAAKDLGPHPRLMIAGDGWKRKELETLVHDLGLSDQVRFTGWLKTPQAALASLDTFVLPSLVEGFPLALLEAMACGIPSIAHPMPSTARLIGAGVNGMLADLKEPERLAQSLVAMFRSGPAQRRNLGKAAASTIATDFSRRRRMPDILQALDLGASALPAAQARELRFDKPRGN